MKYGILLLLLLLFICSFVQGCGSTPVTPNSIQQSDPLLNLPATYLDKNLVGYHSLESSNSTLKRNYPGSNYIQGFEYQDQLILGHIVAYDSSLDALIQHDRIAANQKNIIRPDSLYPYFGRHNGYYIVDEASGKPHLNFLFGDLIVSFMLDPTSIDRPKNIAVDLALQYVEQFLSENQSITNVPPYFVEARFSLSQTQPARGAFLTPGSDIVFTSTVDYSLAIPDKGQLEFRWLQGDLLIKQKVLEVSKGSGSIPISETLQIASDVPAGTTFSVIITLTPPYETKRLPFYLPNGELQRTSDSEYRFTAFDKIDYKIR